MGDLLLDLSEFELAKHAGVLRAVAPVGGGLVPSQGGPGAGGGSVNYVINIQNGNGNIASNDVIETDVRQAINR